MKLILFAFAAIAFSGSSKAKTRDEATPSEPEKPVPQTKPQPVPQPVVPIPEPAVELSAEEKENPVTAFGGLKTKVDTHRFTAFGALKLKVKDEEEALALANSKFEKAEKAKEDALKNFVNISDLSEKQSDSEAVKQKRKTDLQKLKEIRENAEKAAEEATQTVKDTNTRVIKAKTAFNEEFDKMVAAEHELRSKGSLLVQKANEIAESKKQEAKKAGEAVAESKKALEKQRQIKANLENGKASFLSEAAKKAAMDDAEVNIAKKDSQRLKDEEALGVAQANGVNALKGAEYLETERSVLAAFYDKFFSSNQNKKY